jgi:peptidoglycan/LPS O-acetylase OafA/YrhL
MAFCGADALEHIETDEKIMSTKQVARDRINNFNIIRFIAASSVILYHAPGQLGMANPFGHLGDYAVKIFFVISGYLITGSFFRTQSVGKFMRARVLRIFPALLVIAGLTAFVIGPLVSDLSWRAYFSNLSPYVYFIGTSLLVLGGHGHINGLFTTTPKSSPNGSLWTLLFEFVAYIGTLIAGKLKLIKTLPLALVLALLYAMSIFDFRLASYQASTFASLFIAYVFGMLAYIHREKLLDLIHSRAGDILAALLSVVLVICFVTKQGAELYVPVLAYVTLWFSFTRHIRLEDFGTKIDASYGMYIFAWPIQQLVAQYVPGIPLWLDIIVVFALTSIFSILSYKLIEKPAMKYK